MSTNLRLRGCAAVVAALAVLGGASCSDTVRTGRSPAYLIIEGMEGIHGADDSLVDANFASDVRTFGGVYEDSGVAHMRIAFRDVDYNAAVGPTDNNAITINRYRVSYRRADGRNTPGADVPWPFEGATTATIREDTESVSFVLVRIQAKLESPLVQIVSSTAAIGGAGAISTVADVTFYGRDQAGNEVTVTGSMDVTFADWADPDN
jgi:hypothetical protein